MKKKVYFIALMAMFCVQGIWAQEVEEMDSVPTPHESGKEAVTQVKKIKEADVQEIQAQLAEMRDIFDKMKESYEKDSFDPDKPIFKPPVKGKHYRYQVLTFAPMGGASKDKGDNILPSSGVGEERFDDADEQTDQQSSFGLNFGWEMINVWGKNTENGFQLNKYGFAWSYGFIGDYKVQGSEHLFSFMGKIGVEAGNSHRMGIGIDALVGFGKGFGFEYDLDFPEDDPDSYSKWCPKVGFQISVRTGIIKSVVKNADMNLFLRYDRLFSSDGFDVEKNTYKFGHEEEWNVGMVFKFRI